MQMYVNLSFFLIKCCLLSYAKKTVRNCKSMDLKKHSTLYQDRDMSLKDFDIWPNNTVPYIFDDHLTVGEKSFIRESMNFIENESCVKWVPKLYEEYHLVITNAEDACFATPGYNEIRGYHVLNLASDSDDETTCYDSTLILHELLHVLGFAHEHNRPDRNSFITIFWESMIPEGKLDFIREGGINEILPPVCNNSLETNDFDGCYSGRILNTFGLEYDYGSIMHYGEYTYSNNEEKTMKAKKEGINQFGQGDTLTDLDKQKLNTAYSCSK